MSNSLHNRDALTGCLGFNGQLHEPGCSWQLLGNGHRAYNPILMRFHSPDALSPMERGGINAYTYCGNEPVSRADPSGASAIHAWFFGAAGIIASAGAVTMAVLSDSKTEKIVLGVFAAATVAGVALGAASYFRQANRNRLRHHMQESARQRTLSRSPSLRSERASQPAGGYVDPDDFADWVSTRFPGRAGAGLQADDLPPAYSQREPPPQVTPPSSPPPSYSSADGKRWSEALRRPAAGDSAGSHLASQLMAKLQHARPDSPLPARRNRPGILTRPVPVRRRDFALRMSRLRSGA